MRDALVHAGKNGRRVASAFIGTAFAQDDAEAGRLQWRRVANELRPRLPKLRPRRGQDYVLVSMSFSAAHRAKLHSTNPIERLNGEIKGAPQSVGSVRGPVMSRRILEILARALSHSRRYCRKRFKARISAYCNDIVIPSRPRET